MRPTRWVNSRVSLDHLNDLRGMLPAGTRGWVWDAGTWETEYLGGELEVTKGAIKSDWEEKKGEKMWYKGGKMGKKGPVAHKHVGGQYTCLAMPCSWSLQSLLFKLYSWLLSLVRGSLFCVHLCVRSASHWRRDHRSQGPCVWGASTLREQTSGLLCVSVYQWVVSSEFKAGLAGKLSGLAATYWSRPKSGPNIEHTRGSELATGGIRRSEPVTGGTIRSWEQIMVRSLGWTS